MASPVFIDCTKDSWEPVAINVLAGTVHKISLEPNIYLQTYVMTGVAAPTGRDKGVPAFPKGNPEDISASSGIDVYIWADKVDGRVRVDI